MTSRTNFGSCKFRKKNGILCIKLRSFRVSDFSPKKWKKKRISGEKKKKKNKDKIKKEKNKNPPYNGGVLQFRA